MSSSLKSKDLLVGQQPLALEEELKPWLPTLQAQLKKSFKKLASDAGAE